MTKRKKQRLSGESLLTRSDRRVSLAGHITTLKPRPGTDGLSSEIP